MDDPAENTESPTPDHEDEDLEAEFIFQYSSLADSLSDFHPSPHHRRILWTLFKENISPVTMILHKPSIKKLVFPSTDINTPSALSRSSESLLFAIYFAALCSMDPAQCPATFGQTHASLLHHYRFLTQQALARAHFLHSPTLASLQATTLFLTALRDPRDADFVFAMTAAVLRIAQGMGLHRDGAAFGPSLTPFEIEMRRRLWWAIYLLDTRVSEGRGMGTGILAGSYDAKQPASVNDEDLAPEMTRAPAEREGFTDMTFCLVRCEMIMLNRRSPVLSGGSGSGNRREQDLGQQLQELEQMHAHLRRRYLRFCDISVPLQWVTATVIRLALARSWLLAHLEDRFESRPMGPTSLSEAQRRRLLSTAIEVLEFAYLLETDPRTNQWSWLFCAYPQWHAVLFVLTELSACASGLRRDGLVDRAWGVTVKVVRQWRRKDVGQGGITMKVVLGHMERAAGVLGVEWERREYMAEDGWFETALS